MTSSWMLVAGALFATMGVFAKLLAGQFTGAELSLYRSLIGLARDFSPHAPMPT